jgi:hypothetical protein
MSIFKFAENILNNLDQTTQSSIQTALNKSTNEADTRRQNQQQTTGNLLGSSSAANLPKSDIRSSSTRNSSNSNLKASWHNKTNSLSHKDDELMQFLNDDTSIENLSEPLARSSKSSLIKTDTSGMKLVNKLKSFNF